MKRAQLRADFEQTFPNLDMKKEMYMTNPPKFGRYIELQTQLCWSAWINAFETYAHPDDYLTGEYDDSL